MKRSILLLLFVCACLAIPAGAKRLTQGFKIAKMRLDLPCLFEAAAPSLEIKGILAQPFRYLDRGAQCYAFLSEDGNYVLKLFRFDQKHLFFNKQAKRPFDVKVAGFFKGCELAFTKASDETGLVYLHLGKTSSKLPVLRARGPLGFSFQLPLDHYRFALQKKAEPLLPGLFEAQRVGRLPEKIDEIVSLLERRISKGIGNRDPSLWRNFGFLKTQAIEIDFGNYIERPDFSERKRARAELMRYMRPLRSWIKKNAPECLDRFNARLEETR